MNTQEFARIEKSLAVTERNLQAPGFSMQPDFGREEIVFVESGHLWAIYGLPPGERQMINQYNDASKSQA